MFRSMRAWFRSLVAITGLCVLLAPVSSCSLISPGSSGGSGAGSESDAANLSVLYDFGSGGAPRCTGSSTWIYTPISLTGSTGRTERIVEQQSYDQAADASDRCVFRAGQLGLKKGTWRIQGTLAGECDVDIQATTAVAFRQGSAGCTKFP
jgi:enamine deaminase RidA (YjgF/YER057c/UK114 family)